MKITFPLSNSFILNYLCQKTKCNLIMSSNLTCPIKSSQTFYLNLFLKAKKKLPGKDMIIFKRIFIALQQYVILILK